MSIPYSLKRNNDESIKTLKQLKSLSLSVNNILFIRQNTGNISVFVKLPVPD